MKKFFTTFLIATFFLLSFSLKAYAVVPLPPDDGGGDSQPQQDLGDSSVSCTTTTPSATTASISAISQSSHTLGAGDVTVEIAAASSGDTISYITASSVTGSGTKQATFSFSGLTASTAYTATAFDSSGNYVEQVPSCNFTTTAATTTAAGGTQQSTTTGTADQCANGVGDEGTYGLCCTGQSSQDSLSCQSFASYLIAESEGSPQCANITSDTVYAACCSNGSTSGNPVICNAYATRDTNTSNPGTLVGGQVGSGVSTAAVNNNNNALTNLLGGLGQTSSAGGGLGTCKNIQFGTLLDIAIWAKCVIGVVIIPGIFSLAFLIFLWGVLKFIRSSEKTDKQDAKQLVIAGLIGLFVMTSVWGIIKILNTTLGIDSTVPMLQTDYLSPSNASQNPNTIPAAILQGVSH